MTWAYEKASELEFIARTSNLKTSGGYEIIIIYNMYTILSQRSELFHFELLRDIFLDNPYTDHQTGLYLDRWLIT